MARIGYARVSTKDQNLDLQLAELEKAGCEKVYSEHKSGIKARLKLAEAIKYLRKGDILVVYKFDRLGRSLSDLLNIISELHEKGVEIMSLKDNIDTSSTRKTDDAHLRKPSRVRTRFNNRKNPSRKKSSDGERQENGKTEA